MRIEERLCAHYEEFSENEKYVCHCLSGHLEEFGGKTLERAAADLNVSKTLLVRFAKKLGLSGYSELRARIRLERKEDETCMEGTLQAMTDSYHKMMDDLMKKDLTGFFDKLDKAGRVFVYGSGYSQARACSEMKRIFLPVKEIVHLHGQDLLYGLQKTASPGDLVIILSLSGETEAVVKLAKALRVRHIPTVSITRLQSNTLASLCEENLYIHSIRLPVGDPVGYESTTPYFILIEFLYLSYRDYLARRQPHVPADGR